MTLDFFRTSYSFSRFTTVFDRILLNMSIIPPHGESMDVKWMIYPSPVKIYNYEHDTV